VAHQFQNLEDKSVEAVLCCSTPPGVKHY
jgi:hypothetical protein